MTMGQESNSLGSRTKVYGIITDRIISLLDSGIVPWKKPWSDSGLPKNLISQKEYRGINTFILSAHEYESNQFLTFKQLKDIGGKVKKDEKGFPVIFWKFNSETNQTSDDTSENIDVKSNPLVRYYTVFNIDQCEDIPDVYIPPFKETRSIPSCEQVIDGIPSKPTIQHKEQRAYYNPLLDVINMPKKATFITDESYYSTLFHELVHSTGHHTRLSRIGLIQMSEFGSDSYSLEELVAEIGTCYLLSFSGLSTEITQSAAYIQGWLAKLKNDKSFIISAASLAQKATDYILNIKKEPLE